MANVYTLKDTYPDCDNRIWREAQISENAYLSDLGYMILALLTHLHITYFIFTLKN